MAQMKVVIQDHIGTKTPAELPDDVPMKWLLPALLLKLGLPTSYDDYFWEFHRNSPESIVYAIEHRRTGRRISVEDTLSGIGVLAEDILSLYPEVSTDWLYLENVMVFPSGKNFSEIGVTIALQLDDLITAFIVPKRMPLQLLREFIRWQSVGRGKSLSPTQSGHLSRGILRNKSSGNTIDEKAGFTVGDVICSGDLISTEIVRPTFEQQDKPQPSEIIRITRKDIEGRHNP